MGKSASINFRVDEDTKSQARSVFDDLGMTVSQGIVLFLRQVILYRGIPFDLKIPNELTAKTLEMSEAGEDLHTVSSVDELFKELNA